MAKADKDMALLDADSSETQTLEAAKKLNNIEQELQDTLVYLNEELKEIDDNTSLDLVMCKKLFVEQKLTLLRQLSAIVLETRKLKESTTSFTDITQLLDS
jgi:uncharacterized tellurite resistance protein B-like protein